MSFALVLAMWISVFGSVTVFAMRQKEGVEGRAQNELARSDAATTATLAGMHIDSVGDGEARFASSTSAARYAQG